MYAIRITPAHGHLFAGESRLVKTGTGTARRVTTYPTRAAAESAIAKIPRGNVWYNVETYRAPACDSVPPAESARKARYGVRVIPLPGTTPAQPRWLCHGNGTERYPGGHAAGGAGVNPLQLHGKEVTTIFDLLGRTENDMTYSLGWCLAQVPAFLDEVITNVGDYFREQPSEEMEPHFLYSLGPPIRPNKKIPTGGRWRANRVWCFIDTLLTCETIAAAREETDDRLAKMRS